MDGVSDDKGRTELAHTARREASLPNEVKGPRAVVTLQPRRPARKIEARPFNALVAYNDDYVQPLIVAAIEKHLAADSVRLIPTDGLDDLNKELHISSLQSAATSAAPATPLLLIVPYEAIPFGLIRSEAMSEQPTVFANSYCFRKALIRKHYLAATIEHWIAKRRQQQQQRQHAGNTNNGPPTILLESHVKRSEVFELDYAEFLDDALTECWDLRASLARNEEIEADDGTEGMCNKKKEWWILKPGMGDRGHGIRLFSTMRELEEIFEEWEADESDDEEEGDEMEVDDEDKERSEELGGEDITKHSLGHERDDNEQHDSAVGTSSPTGIRASHLRHFVAQPYLDPPFLLPTDRRKFHLRAYVLCVGGGGGGGGGVMQVYVFRKMLALFAATEYVSPDVDSQHLGGHLTNTCLQLEMLRGSTGEDREGRMEDRTKEKPLVNTFWNLPLPPSILEGVFDQICAVTGELFEAAATGGMAAHFEPLGNCFEVYGLDFLLTPSPDVADKEGEEGMAVVGAAVPHVWLLEVNSFPDFRQSGTGPGPKAVVADFWAAVVRRVARAFFDGQPVGSQGQEEEEAHCSDGVELQDGAQQSEEADQGIDGDDDGMRLVARVMLAKSGWGPRAGPAGSVSTED